MKKRIIAMLLMLMLAVPAAMAEFDTAALRAMENTTTFIHPGTVNTVTRLVNQPYWGQAEDGSLLAYVDYITMPDYDATLLRLLLGTESYVPLGAQEIRAEVGGKRYTFTVTYEQTEYDGIYMEDYAICLTDASLPMLKAIAQQKKDTPIPVEFIRFDEVIFAGEVVIPGVDAALLYDTFIDLGGKTQALKKYDEIWPCKVDKAK